MWFKSKRVRDLEAQVFDLEHALFETQSFERIASEKVKVWVKKHDELLIRYKALAERFRKLHPRTKI